MTTRDKRFHQTTVLERHLKAVNADEHISSSTKQFSAERMVNGKFVVYKLGRTTRNTEGRLNELAGRKIWYGQGSSSSPTEVVATV